MVMGASEQMPPRNLTCQYSVYPKLRDYLYDSEVGNVFVTKLLSLGNLCCNLLNPLGI